MIRIAKTNEKPASLTTTKAYEGEDVKRRLFADQLSKCYLCERVVSTDFQIEHLKSCQNYPELRTEWRNLLLSCNYCNQKKGCRFDNIINPLECNVEDIIEQRIDYVSKRATFESHNKTSEVEAAIHLLESIFNGESKLRKLKEEKFYEEVESILNRFIQKVNAYKYSPSETVEDAIREELTIDMELLGFKYWIIKGEPALYAVFANDIIWNKQ